MNNNLKKEWCKPEIESLEISETMNNGNANGHCKHGEVPGVGLGHDKYDFICS